MQFILHDESDSAGQESIMNAILICIINMTRCDFGITQAISNSNFLETLESLITGNEVSVENREDRLMLCTIILSNVAIDAKIINAHRPEILNALEYLKNRVNFDDISNPVFDIGYLKLLHNLVIANFDIIKDVNVKQ